uniref:Selenide, water dikinase n=1 Tax=Stomoxys calcitrans TaxID=35570 RepID=A0A1I8NWD1_STOCA
MFKPEAHGLPPDFQLTKFSTLRGCGCKIPQDTLNKYLLGTEILTANTAAEKNAEHDDDYIGTGMDCAVIPLKKHPQLRLVQTVDFFYPLVNDPYTMGKIALANVVSDVYAVGVTDLDKLDIILSAPTEISEEERNIIMPLIAEGFRDAAQNAKVNPYIKNSVINPWCMIGGIASAVVKREEVIMPNNAKAGDHLVLTKPLGTQLATNAYLWMCDKTEKYEELLKYYSEKDIVVSFQMAVKSMTYLNRNAALLMHKYQAHAATDVTGFGLLGHAQNLAEFQRDNLRFVIEKLPIITNILGFAEKLNYTNAKLRSGKSVETSGGLLIAMPPQASAEYCKEFNAMTNGEQNAWIVGHVAECAVKEAVLGDNVELLEVILPVDC